MTKLTTEEIRSKFINYFIKNNHANVSASSLIPHNDPSLMFVNSGMVQFKDVFTGKETRNYNKAVTSQKSLRAGGKHNDLENVGYTARHHTFFEMLGNFSFGDYFKEEAIYYAWELLTKEFLLPKNKLYVTVFHTDDEAASYWKKIANLTDERIIRIKTTDNFWSMGDTGPCGPCSEIFYDHGSDIKGGLPGTPDENGDRFIEIWNMVFMQFEQVDKDTRIELPKKSIDTGMGLERITAVMQHVHNNYEIDLFKEIIAFTENIVKIPAKGDAVFSYRVIADHLRACSFLISDGVIPSNEGRGYVLRRIMRRAMRHAHILGTKEPLIYKLLPKLIELMGGAYPELKRAEDFISNILEQEEMRFNTTLERGLKLLDEEVKNVKQGSKLSGSVAFKLYDTYGFPLDLTEDILKNKNITVDQADFDKNMQEQKERARKSWLGSNESTIDKIWFNLKSEFGSTEFLGYNLNDAEGVVLGLIKNNIPVESISKIGEAFILVSNQTPFYGESGGQMGDIGSINTAQAKIKVTNTLKYLGSIIAHICILEAGEIKLNDNAHFNIDVKYRKNLKIHHSATHILQAVLQEILGRHVTQKGSLVAAEYLRFDVSHSAAITEKELVQIEDKVNQIITDNYKVTTNLMSTEDAIKSGAMALFGEKYDSEVRVVSIGEENQDNSPYSLELCGGTHVKRTGDIGSFKIISENGIAAGIRRIEAVCGEFAIKLMRNNENVIKSLEFTLKSETSELLNKVNHIVNRSKELEKELVKLQIAALDLTIDQILAESINIAGIKLIYKVVQDLDTKILRSAAEQISKKLDNLVVIYIGGSSEKLSITVAISKNLIEKFHAGNLAKEISIFLGGNGGGGQPTIAQAGGNDHNKLQYIIDKIKKLLS